MRENKRKIIEERYQGKWFLSVKSPLIVDQDIWGVIGFSVDISEQKKVDELTKQQEIQQSIIAKLKTIAGSLSHEIRTPMAGVRMELSLLKNFFKKLQADVSQITVESLVEQEKQVERMVQRIDTGTALINMQLKNMTAENISTDQFKVHSMGQCIQEAIDTFPFDNSVIRDKVHVCLQQEFNFWGDPLLTRHVLWNLLNNALHFIKETDRGEIFITTEKKEGQYYIRFKDTAKGMPPEQAEKVFEQFYTNRSGGCGLGLNFCCMVMQAYDGDITCQAVEDEYAEFLLSFPGTLPTASIVNDKHSMEALP